MTDENIHKTQCDGLAKLKIALRKNRRDAHHRYFQLATLAGDGTPRNRTVVFRGFGPDNHSLLAITDSRSEKATELAVHNRGEIAWYFTHTREQFRLRGQMVVVGCDAPPTELLQLREETWQARSDAAQDQFFWRPPGLARGEGGEIEARDLIPDSFMLLAFQPDYIDHLVLARIQTRRLSRYVDGGWDERWVNP